jgi:predicted DNA binding protein
MHESSTVFTEMYEASFRLNHDSLYADITSGREATIEMWCNNHCDLLYIDGAQAGSVAEAIEDRIGVKETVDRDGETVLVTADCLLGHETDLLETYLRRHACLSLPPRLYVDGQLTARVIALAEPQLKDIYRDLSTDHAVTVEAKRELEIDKPDAPLLMTSAALPTLSTRQEKALVTAYDAGYYAIPRECTTSEIGDRLGIGRRTAEEHLRIAERKVVEGFIDYILWD